MKVILIRVPAAEQDYSLVSQLRDFAEDIYREFGMTGIAEVPDMDSATTELHIYIPRTRHLGTVSAFVAKRLKKHGLSDLADVTRSDRPKPEDLNEN